MEYCKPNLTASCDRIMPAGILVKIFTNIKVYDKMIYWEKIHE